MEIPCGFMIILHLPRQFLFKEFIMEDFRIIRLTPTIVASRAADGSMDIMEFESPRIFNGAYGYLMKYSYKTADGKKVLGVLNKDYYCRD